MTAEKEVKKKKEGDRRRQEEIDDKKNKRVNWLWFNWYQQK